MKVEFNVVFNLKINLEFNLEINMGTKVKIYDTSGMYFETIHTYVHVDF